MSTPKCAIVTTLKNADNLITSFIQYHLKIGFYKIYLFFDDEYDTGIPIAAQFPEVTIVPNNVSLQERWTKASSYSESRKKFLETEVMERQILNADVALRMADEDGMDWLLHIDIDELFYTKNATIHEHFTGLINQGFDMVSYLNFEAVTTTMDVDDSFKEVRLFKKHKSLLSETQLELVNKTSELNFGKDYFWFYGNGKSAVRVNKDVVPNGVHLFKHSKNHLKLTHEDLVILHYPICGFEQFINKYRDLGDFDNKWFGEVDITFRMHLESRDVVTSGNHSKAKDFYRNEIEKLKKISLRLIHKGIWVEIDGPSEILSATSKKK